MPYKLSGKTKFSMASCIDMIGVIYFAQLLLQLQHRLEQCERRPSDINNKPDGEKKSPEENMAIIQLYGGIQFPDSMELDVTPSTVSWTGVCRMESFNSAVNKREH